MKCDINWDREDFWNELYKCEEYFLSFNFDHCAFEEDKWIELVEKWKLNTKVTIGDSRYDPESEDITAYNEDYTIVVTGMGNDTPGYYLILTFSKDIDMGTVIKFLSGFMTALDHYDDLVVREGIMGEYNSHPKDIIKIMVEKLK